MSTLFGVMDGNLYGRDRPVIWSGRQSKGLDTGRRRLKDSKLLKLKNKNEDKKK